MSKAQGLPMTTIVLIILVIVVLVGVLLFFFKGLGSGKEGVTEQTIYGKCQAECLKLNQGGISCSTYKSTSNKAGVNCCNYLDCDKPDGTACC